MEMFKGMTWRKLQPLTTKKCTQTRRLCLYLSNSSRASMHRWVGSGSHLSTRYIVPSVCVCVCVWGEEDMWRKGEEGRGDKWKILIKELYSLLKPCKIIVKTTSLSWNHENQVHMITPPSYLSQARSYFPFKKNM